VATVAEITQYVHDMFPQLEWSNALSIISRESGFNSDAINNTARPDLPGYHEPGENDQPEYSMGLFQINTLAWPDLASQLNLLDPFANIQAASIIFQGHGWQPWGGAPIQYAPPGEPTAPGISGGGGGTGTIGMPGTPLAVGATSQQGVLTQIGEFFKRASDLLAYLEINLARGIVRAVLMILGTLITLIGLYFLMMSLGE